MENMTEKNIIEKSGELKLNIPVVFTKEEKDSDVKKIICDICGHANPAHAAMCKMCSNYLKGDK